MQIHLEVAQLFSQTIKKRIFHPVSQAILICGVPAESSKTVSTHLCNTLAPRCIKMHARVAPHLQSEQIKAKRYWIQSRGILGTHRKTNEMKTGREYYCNTFRLLTSWHSAECHCHDFISRGPLRRAPSLFSASRALNNRLIDARS